MKNYSRIFFMIAALLTVAFVSFYRISNSYRSTETDTLLLNDIVKTVKENWGEFDKLDDSDFDTEMLVFGNNGFIVYSSAKTDLSDVQSVEEAVHKGCICMTISEGSRYYGTVVIPDPDKAKYDMIRQRLFITGGLMTLALLATILLYGVYVNRTIVKPFKKMEKFAVHVAAGSLDEPLMLDKYNMFGSFTTSFDIMREELKAARQRENAIKMKEREMVASLSHDLKTPITGIKLTCELLEVKLRDEYTLEKIGNIRKKAEQINVLVSDLMAAALDDLGEMNVNCQDENSEVLHELVKELDTRSLARESSVPQCMINVDKSRLSQIIGNIFSNSYKYADTTIDIDYRTNENYLEMSIRDYGVGVSENEINLITTKFYRGSAGKNSGKDGSGLGLYIASELMAKMNGELFCSCREKGLTVTLLIPLS